MASRSVTIRTFSGEEASGTIETQLFTSTQRTKRALIRSGTALLITLVGAIVPVAHFVIVPVGLVATAIIFWKYSSTGELVTSGNIECPCCHKKISLYPRALNLPLKESCEHCLRQVLIG